MTEVLNVYGTITGGGLFSFPSHLPNVSQTTRIDYIVRVNVEGLAEGNALILTPLLDTVKHEAVQITENGVHEFGFSGGYSLMNPEIRIQYNVTNDGRVTLELSMYAKTN